GVDLQFPHARLRERRDRRDERTGDVRALLQRPARLEGGSFRRGGGAGDLDAERTGRGHGLRASDAEADLDARGEEGRVVDVVDLERQVGGEPARVVARAQLGRESVARRGEAEALLPLDEEGGAGAWIRERDLER